MLRYVLSFWLLVAVCMSPARAEETLGGPGWEALRKLAFGDRPVSTDASRIVELFVREQADDAAFVPILIRTRMEQKPDRYIKHLWLMIDNNPSPFGSRFTLTPDSGRADIETRVRLESSSPVRIIAELNDGSLWMASKLVFGAGGCSAAASKNPEAMRNLGKVKFLVEQQFAEPGEPFFADLKVSHPQFSGIGGDNPEPARFIREVRVFYADRLVLSADLDFTISENPSFRFYFLPGEGGELRAELTDTTDLRIETRLQIEPEKLRAR